MKTHSAAWQAFRELTNLTSSPVIKIKGAIAKECLDAWFHHFKFLLDNPEQNPIDLSDPFYNQKVSDPLPINTNPFTNAELEACLLKINNSKTPGPDHISAIIWKNPLFKEQFCNSCILQWNLQGQQAMCFLQVMYLPKTKEEWPVITQKPSGNNSINHCIKNLQLPPT